MKRLKRFSYTLLVFFIITDVQAIGGVGDITFDPTVNSQLIKMYEEGLNLYENAKAHLQTASEINRTIYEAEQAYDAIVNFNLKATAEKMFGFGSTQGAEGRWKIDALLGDLNRMESGGRNTGRFFNYQVGRLENMQAMFAFQEEAAKNIEAATQDIPERQSAQITAQSTASIAALLAAQDQREQQADLEREAAKQQDSDAFFRSKRIYEGFSGEGGMH